VVRSAGKKVALDMSRSFGWRVSELPSSRDLDLSHCRHSAWAAYTLHYEEPLSLTPILPYSRDSLARFLICSGFCQVGRGAPRQADLPDECFSPV
jgi:hypothetical protein